LYGLSVTYTDTKRTRGRIHLDGGCGFESVRAAMEAVGLTLRRVHSDSRTTVYTLHDSGANS